MGRIGAVLFDAAMAPLERVALQRWRRRLWGALPRSGRGLEIGAGTGANCAHYPGGAAVVALDRSFGSLRRARSKSPGARMDCVVADAGALPFRAGSFDWAAETLVLCEVESPANVLAELSRVLRPGAPFALLEHVRPGGWLGMVADAISRLTGPLVGEHFDRDTGATLDGSTLRVARRTLLWRDVFVLFEGHAPPRRGNRRQR